jgi:hypothetical protein
LLPSTPIRLIQVWLHPSCSPRQHGTSVLGRSHLLGGARHPSDKRRFTPGARFGLCCPDPSSLIRPHPPRSQAHRDFSSAACTQRLRLRERLGDPRAVPGFHCAHPSCHTVPLDPGEFESSLPDSDIDISLRHDPNYSALHLIPAIRFTQGVSFRGFQGSRICHGLSVCLPPCTDPTRFAAVGDFYYQGFQRVSRPSRWVITTTATELHCWWSRRLERLGQPRTITSFLSHSGGAVRYKSYTTGTPPLQQLLSVAGNSSEVIG